MTNLNTVIQRHRESGIVLDTNLLLLLIVGLVDVDLVSTFKRTRMFVPEDFELLTAILGHFKKCFVTPYILTEVSNFIGQVKGPQLNACRSKLAQFVNSSIEDYCPSEQLVAKKEFYRFGITDASLSELATRRLLVLTVDANLAYHLGREKLSALNFSHVRQSKWRD